MQTYLKYRLKFEYYHENIANFHTRFDRNF